MSELITAQCDECGMLKQKANHWFRALAFPGAFQIVQWDVRNILTKTAATEALLDLCGTECATKAMHRTLSEQPQREAPALEATEVVENA